MGERDDRGDRDERPRRRSAETRKLLRERLREPRILRTAGVHDVLSALVLEEAGVEAVFVGGFATSATLRGLPDLDFLGLSEMADAVRRVAARLSLPVIGDADTGYGDLHHVARTVRVYEETGAAGLILEDQTFPKRCGHFESKAVIPLREMEAKWRVALAERDDPDLLFIARTDSRATHGIDEAIRRANRYLELGADMAFIEAPTSREELERIAAEVQGPKLVNMLSFGKTPILSATELEELGYTIVVLPIETLLVSVHAMRELARVILRDGHAGALRERMATFDDLKRLLGLERWLALGGEAREEG